jgi:hypothetical protein
MKSGLILYTLGGKHRDKALEISWGSSKISVRRDRNCVIILDFDKNMAQDENSQPSILGLEFYRKDKVRSKVP